MPSGSQEQDRLKRLRDQQIATRDPLIKQRKLEHTIAQRHRRSVQAFSLGRIWSEIPHKWRGVFYGLVGGVLLVIVLPVVWASSWAVLCSAASIPILAIVGFFFGRAVDTKEEIKDLVR